MGDKPDFVFDITAIINEALDEQSANNVDKKLKEQRKKAEEPIKIKIEAKDELAKLNKLFAESQIAMQRALSAKKPLKEMTALSNSCRELERRSKAIADGVDKRSKVYKEHCRLLANLNTLQETDVEKTGTKVVDNLENTKKQISEKAIHQEQSHREEIEKTTEAIEKQTRAKQKQTKSKLGEYTQDEYDRLSLSEKDKNDFAYVVTDGLKITADFTTKCAKAETAVKRFFKTLGDNHPVLSDWKESMIEMVQNGTLEYSDDSKNPFVYPRNFGVHQYGDDGWYVFLKENLDHDEWYRQQQQKSLDEYTNYYKQYESMLKDHEAAQKAHNERLTAIKEGRMYAHDAINSLDADVNSINVQKNSEEYQAFYDQNESTITGDDYIRNIHYQALDEIKEKGMSAADAISMVTTEIDKLNASKVDTPTQVSDKATDKYKSVLEYWNRDSIKDGDELRDAKVSLMAAEDEGIVSSLQNRAKELDSKIESVNSIRKEILKMSKPTGLFDYEGDDRDVHIAEEYQRISSRLGELHSGAQYGDLNNDELKEYIALQLKAQKIRDQYGSEAGGFKRAGAKNKLEFNRWIENSLSRELGIEPSEKNFASITSAFYGKHGIFNDPDGKSKRRSTLDVVADAFGYGGHDDSLASLQLGKDIKELDAIDDILQRINKTNESTISDLIQEKREVIDVMGDGDEQYSQKLRQELQQLLNIQERMRQLNQTDGTTLSDDADKVTTTELDKYNRTLERLRSKHGQDSFEKEFKDVLLGDSVDESNARDARKALLERQRDLVATQRQYAAEKDKYEQYYESKKSELDGSASSIKAHDDRLKDLSVGAASAADAIAALDAEIEQLKASASTPLDDDVQQKSVDDDSIQYQTKDVKPIWEDSKQVRKTLRDTGIENLFADIKFRDEDQSYANQLTHDLYQSVANAVVSQMSDDSNAKQSSYERMFSVQNELTDFIMQRGMIINEEVNEAKLDRIEKQKAFLKQFQGKPLRYDSAGVSEYGSQKDFNNIINEIGRGKYQLITKGDHGQGIEDVWGESLTSEFLDILEVDPKIPLENYEKNKANMMKVFIETARKARAEVKSYEDSFVDISQYMANEKDFKAATDEKHAEIGLVMDSIWSNIERALISDVSESFSERVETNKTSPDAIKAIGQLKEMENNKTPLIDFSGLRNVGDLDDELGRMISKTDSLKGFTFGGTTLGKDTAQIKLYNKELGTTITQLYKIDELGELQYKDSTYKYNPQAPIDVELEQRLATAKIDRLLAGLDTSTYSGEQDLRELASNIVDHKSLDDFYNELKISKEDVARLRKEMSSDLSTTKKMSNTMLKADGTIKSYKQQYEAVKGVPGAESLQEQINTMKTKKKEFDETNDFKKQVEIFNAYSEAQKKFASNIQPINKEKNAIKELISSYMDLYDAKNRAENSLNNAVINNESQKFIDELTNQIQTVDDSMAKIASDIASKYQTDDIDVSDVSAVVNKAKDDNILTQKDLNRFNKIERRKSVNKTSYDTALDELKTDATSKLSSLDTKYSDSNVVDSDIKERLANMREAWANTLDQFEKTPTIQIAQELVKQANEIDSAFEKINASIDDNIRQSQEMHDVMSNATDTIEAYTTESERFENVGGILDQKNAMSEAIAEMDIAAESFASSDDIKDQIAWFEMYNEARKKYQENVKLADEAYVNSQRQEKKDSSTIWKEYFKPDDKAEFKQMADFYKQQEREIQESNKKMKGLYDQYMSNIYKESQLTSQINAMTLKDGGSGEYSDSIQNLVDQRNIVRADLRTVNDNINSISKPKANEDGLIKFLQMAQNSAALTTNELSKLILAMNQLDKIDFDFKANVLDKTEPMTDKLSQLNELVNNGGITDTDISTEITDMYTSNKTLSDRFKKSGDIHDASDLLGNVSEYEDRVNALTKLAQKEKEYFANKKKYEVGRYSDDGTDFYKKQTQEIEDRREILEKTAQEFAKDGAMVTGFKQTADGIAMLDFSVFDQGTNSIKTFRMEMGKLNNDIYNVETTVDKSVKNDTSKYMKHMGEMSSLISSIGESGYDINPQTASDSVKRVHNIMGEMQKAMASGDTQLLDKIAREAQIATAELQKLYTESTKIQNNLDDGNAENMGAFDFSEKKEAYDQLNTAVSQHALTMRGSRLDIGKFDAEHKKLNYTLTDGKGNVEHYTASVDNLGKRMVTQHKGVDKLQTGFQQLSGMVSHSAKQMLMAFSGYDIFTQIIHVVRQGVGYIKEIDSAMTELKKVTDETAGAYERFLSSARDVGAEIGATTSEYVRATAGFARLGYSMNEAGNMAQSAIVYKNVGDGIDSVDTATNSIISTMKAFGIESNNTMSIVD